MFGVNAELLIEHAWGWEPVTMEYVKAYKPESKSLSSWTGSPVGLHYGYGP